MSGIAVLMGGHSLERDISLRGGRRIVAALEEKGHKVKPIDVDESLVKTMKTEHFDLAFLALHGKYGEDGTVQELLEILKVPYTGPGVLPSMLGMNKELAKEIFIRDGIATPRFYALSAGAFREMGASHLLDEIIERLGLPVVIKPASQGSALGIQFVHEKKDMAQALIGSLSYDDTVLLEEFVDGTEITAGVIGNDELRSLPLVEIIPKKEFFDFESMYTAGATEYFVPARLSEEVTARVQALACQIYRLFGCCDSARIDMIVRDDVPYVLELNTIPGMTETSLLPLAAKEAGIEFPDLCDLIVKLALERNAKRCS